MTKQAETCLSILSDMVPDKIEVALRYIKSGIVRELKQYYEASDNAELADKIYLFK